MEYPKTLINLINCYQKLPGVGAKTAERMALQTLKMEEETRNLFIKSLEDLSKKIKKCRVCNNITENEVCAICLDKKRDKKTICVVEDAKKILMIEKLEIFSGKYHVIEEAVSPLLGSQKIDQTIDPLIKRIKEDKVGELIFALRLTIEGETTVAYISKLLEKEPIKITKIAQGIPHGADIDYIDSLTLERAIEDRKSI